MNHIESVLWHFCYGGWNGIKALVCLNEKVQTEQLFIKGIIFAKVMLLKSEMNECKLQFSRSNEGLLNNLIWLLQMLFFELYLIKRPLETTTYSAVARQGRKGRLPLPKKIIKIFHEKMKEGVIKVTIFLKNNSNRDYDLKSQNFLGQWPLIFLHFTPYCKLNSCWARPQPYHTFRLLKSQNSIFNY